MKRGTFRVASLLLALLMAASVFCAIPLTANAAEVTKIETKSYDIAVAFDNSRSMYMDSKTDWARAKYAMEIFASMLDYEKDRLTVFPMWEVTTDGSTPKSKDVKESTEPIEITSQSHIEKLSKMYTINASGTPFTPVDKAYDFLSKSTKSEKWLIVLTDGAFDGIGNNSAALEQKLLAKATGGVKVQYLGFGSAETLRADVAKGFYTPSENAKTLEAKLIEACNTIFQRSILPANRLDGNSLNLDLSMKKLIVFVQGQGAKVNALLDSNGEKINGTLGNEQRKYSDVKYSSGNDVCVTDTSLYGHVVTFEACAKGTYKLDYTGSADAIQIFYEPDVDIDISFINSDGQKVEKPEDFVAGEYMVSSKMVDASTGEDATSHELMGNNVILNTYVKTSGDSQPREYANGSNITFEPTDRAEIWVEGEYLGKYKISSKDDKKWDWLNDLEIKPDTADFKIDATVLQPQEWFNTKDHENWKPIRVAMTLEGQPLTEEQLASTKLVITTSGDLKYRCEPISGESAYNVYIAQEENGKYIEPETGKYKLNASATYIDEHGEESTAKDDVSFEIQWYSKFWRWLLWILIILAILALILAWCIHPVLPKYVTIRHRNPAIYENSVKVNSNFGVPGWKDYTQIVLSGTPKPIFGKNNAWFNAVLRRKRSEQTFKLENIAVSNITSLNIDGEQGKVNNGKWIDVTGDVISDIVIGNESFIKWSEQDRGKIAPFNGIIEIS